MKKIIFMTIILVLSISSMSLAADFEFDGGFIYTTFDSDTLNDGINDLNESYQSLADDVENDPDTNLENFDKMDDLDNATGYWIGFKSDYFKDELGIGYGIGASYETFSNEVEAKIHITNPDGPEYLKSEDSLEVEVKGFAVNGERKINDYLGITGTIGYYYGDLDYLGKYEEYDGNQTDTDEFSDSADLEGEMGFKVGLSTNYPLSENLNVIGNVNYRFLELDIEDPSELDIDNSDDSIEFDGLEFKAGLSYKF